MKIVADGKTYELEVLDMDGIEVRDFRKATGVSPTEVFLLGEPNDADALELAAGVIWIVRRRAEAGLTYEQVLGSLTFKSFTPADGTEEPPDPPA